METKILTHLPKKSVRGMALFYILHLFNGWLKKDS